MEELLKQMIDYIEKMEKTVEGEWGSCRELEEIIEDGDMPELYFKIKKALRQLR